MKNAIVLLIIGTFMIGCSTFNSLKAFKQPPLHDPIIRDAKTLMPADISGTNTATNDFVDGTNGVLAYFQIAADQDVAEEFGQTFSSCFYVGEVGIQNTNSNSFLAYSPSLQVMVSYYLAEKDWTNHLVLQTNVIRRYKGEFIRAQRHPLTYGDISAIFQYQQQSDPRQQWFNYIQSAGEIAAGAALFVGAPIYPKAVDFAVGIVEPEIQKRLLWDLTLHQANFAARSLKEVVEVPQNSAITGVVFFPKRGIPGIVDNHLVYISSFNSHQRAMISGSLISKNNSATSATLPK